MTAAAMICRTCKSEGRTSRAYEGVTASTAMDCRPYYDEQGKRHDHDSNRVTTSMTCSNGHHWDEPKYCTCWCGWSNRPKEKP